MSHSEDVASFKKSLEKQNIEIIHVFSAKCYGPFQYLNEIDPLNQDEYEKLIQYFKRGIYAIAKAKNESIEVFHFENKNPIIIYRPFRFFIGETISNNQCRSLLVFIPKQYLNELRNIDSIECEIGLKELKNALKKHNKFFENFFKRLQEESHKIMDVYFKTTKLKDLALNGNKKSNVPSSIIKAIYENKIGSNEEIPIGQYIAHEENIELPNGQIKTLILTITTNYKGSSIRDYIDDNYSFKETTQNYSILYNLISK